MRTEGVREEGCSKEGGKVEGSVDAGPFTQDAGLDCARGSVVVAASADVEETMDHTKMHCINTSCTSISVLLY